MLGLTWCGLCQTLVSYQGYLCCLRHNLSQKGNILQSLCLVICRPTSWNLFVWHVLMPSEIQMGSQLCQFVPLSPELIGLLLFSPRTCQWHGVVSLTIACPGVGVRGYCRSLRVTRRCCYSPDSITPTLQHPAINYIGCRHGESRDVSSKQHGYLDNMTRRQKRCFHLLAYLCI